MSTKILANVTAHARYEMNILFRSWFFRIFAITAILFLVIIDLTMFSDLVPTPWMFKGISSFNPYVISLFLNIGQAALIVFLATDIMKRDKKLDSSQVIQIRSMSNAGYIWGKALGLILAFGILDIFVLFVTAVLHLALGASEITLVPYLIYPVLIILPTMLFSIGLSFWMMRFLKNQALSILLMLGVMAVSMFVLKNQSAAVFDIFALYIPAAYSDFTGITNLTGLLMQRGSYLIMAAAFLMWVSFAYTRLVQSFLLHKISLILAVSGFVIAAFLSFNLVSKVNEGQEIRAEFKKINQEWKDRAHQETEKCKIELTHSGNEISVKASLVLSNKTSAPLKQYIFSLNPALKIQNITLAEKALNFDRNLHLITIAPAVELLPGKTDSITIEYSGQINEQICYAQVDEKKRSAVFNIWMSKVDKKYMFLEADYVLLPPNCLWYPSSGLPLGSVFPEKNGMDFSKFELTVKTDEDLTVFSQGQMIEKGKGLVKFTPKKPLPFISLIIGAYEQKSLEIDSVSYSLAALKNHHFYEEIFKGIGDTLSSIIREAKQDIERDAGLEYPYRRLQIIETPLQFFTYKRHWTAASPSILPQQIWVPEKLITIDNADFARSFRMQERFASDLSLTDKEKQINIIKQFFQSTFLGRSIRRFRFGPDITNIKQDFSIAPHFFTFTNNFSSQDYTLLNNAVESFILARISGGASPASMISSGFTQEEKVSLKLRNRSLQEVLGDSSVSELFPDIIKTKGDFLISLLQSYAGTENFNKDLLSFLKENRFRVSSPEGLFSQWQEKYNINAVALFDEWLKQKKLPAVLIKNLEMYKVYDGGRLRYQLLFDAANHEDIPAMVRINFQFGGRRGRFMGEDSDEEPARVIRIDGRTAKEAGIVLDSEPRGMSINTILAKNIPLVFSKRFEKTEIMEDEIPFDGEVELDKLFTFLEADEIVVDNEDSAFVVLDSIKQNFIQKLFGAEETNNRDEYSGFRYWRAPRSWEKIKNTDFYGEYIHSALYIRSGDGNKNAAWKAFIKKSGYYDVYTFITPRRSLGGRRMDDDIMKEFEYTIHHDDGAETISMDIRQCEQGWNHLGSFYFSEGETQIQISNKSDGRIVIADAVKWVKR